MTRLPEEHRRLPITVGEAVDTIGRVLEDANRVLVRRDRYVELMNALDAFGMREFPTDSVKLRRIKQAYLALRNVPVE